MVVFLGQFIIKIESRKERVVMKGKIVSLVFGIFVVLLCCGCGKEWKGAEEKEKNLSPTKAQEAEYCKDCFDCVCRLSRSIDWSGDMECRNR